MCTMCAVRLGCPLLVLCGTRAHLLPHAGPPAVYKQSLKSIWSVVVDHTTAKIISEEKYTGRQQKILVGLKGEKKHDSVCTCDVFRHSGEREPRCLTPAPPHIADESLCTACVRSRKT